MRAKTGPAPTVARSPLHHSLALARRGARQVAYSIDGTIESSVTGPVYGVSIHGTTVVSFVT